MPLTQQHRAIAQSNPEHFRRALERASYTVRSDGRLLGIPSVRPMMIEVAAMRAIGADIQLDKKVWLDQHEENHPAIVEVLDRAVEEARAAISDLPPPRRA